MNPARPPPVVDYRPPQPRPVPFQVLKLEEILFAAWIFLALLIAFETHVVSQRIPTTTPQYQAYQRMVRALATTRPIGVVYQPPPYVGAMWVRRPLYREWGIYVSAAVAVAGVVAHVLFVRWRWARRQP